MKKVVPKLRQEVKVKVDIVTSNDISIYYTGKFQDFTVRNIINICVTQLANSESITQSQVFTVFFSLAAMMCL